MRVLAVTAVPAERDAVVTGAAGDGAAEVVALPVGGYALHRVRAGERPAVVLDVLAAGVGPAAAAAGTAAALTAAVCGGSGYHLVISAGIGGGFAPAAPVGATVVADEIVAADLGAETPDGFVPVTELGFGTVVHTPPPDLVRALAAATGAACGAVLTASTVTGSAGHAARLAARHPRALIEAMEGFGVAEAAAAQGLPVLEIRTVSNPVGPRDRAAWRIGDALGALSAACAALPRVLTAAGTPTSWRTP
ncbi:futalosine hydrolase [Streptomyces albofaciens JCM 4342]|uniref:futalosine hydrolase n=1 Tax=Streptomyces albofaciens TaxID=66866 RepID=UPI0012386989|nr:futalosine hydrolase [Streptomyces albofaciens]KAA6215472.1 futalosine hydrolase [Streptomyces albofaciens JCM 4342]